MQVLQMRVTFALVITILLVTKPALCRGINIEFAVAPSDVGILKTGEFDLFSDDLNGQILSGQSLSLDFVFRDSMLARVFASTFGLGVTVYTDAGTYPGFADTATGFLLDADENQYGSPESAGRAMGSNGTFSVGLPYLSISSGVMDIRGVHFDIMLPDTGYTVTDARLRFSFRDSSDAVKFGTAQQLPEKSRTLESFVLGMLALGLLSWRMRTN